jgi:hypothetical protein
MRGPYPTSPGIGDSDPTLTAAAPTASAIASPPAPAVAAGTRGAAAPPPIPAARGATATAAAGPGAALGSAMREEVWAIVRAAVEEAMGPVMARQRELEARVERAERGGGAGASARPPQAAPAIGMASIPVAFGPSVAPPAFSAPRAAAVPSVEAPPPARGRMLSLPPQGYGVTVMQSTRPTLDLDAVGPVDIDGFDGGRRKRRVATAVVVLMLMIIIGAVTMTVISQS